MASAHPTISDVALALATRNPRDTQTKVSISDENAKGVVQIGVEVTDPDPLKAAKWAADLYRSLRAEWPAANGAEAKA